jgi:hypothetical protein
MAGGGGFVWLGNKNGSVTQIRSANNRTITPVADRAVRLVAATVDGGAWALFGSVDAPSATLRKVSKNEHVIQLHMSPINGVAIVRNHIWVLGDHTMTEVKENGKIGDTVDTPDSSMSIVAGTTVFVAGPDEIRQYKPSGESFGRAVEITNIRAIALTSAGPSKGLWVAADEYLVRVDPQTMSIGPHPRDLPAAPLALVSTRDAVWLLFDDGIVWALGREAATTLVTKVPSGATPVGMTAQGDSAYVLMSDGMIFAIDDEAGPKHGIIKAFPNTACDHC